jgi:hypothetical protein
MTVRFRYDSWFARLIGVGAITLYPFVFVATKRDETPMSMVQHEWVHVRQLRTLGWFGFYASYLWKYVVGVFRYGSRDKAYMSVSYEVEAYAQEHTVALSQAELDEWKRGMA